MSYYQDLDGHWEQPSWARKARLMLIISSFDREWEITAIYEYGMCSGSSGSTPMIWNRPI